MKNIIRQMMVRRKKQRNQCTKIREKGKKPKNGYLKILRVFKVLKVSEERQMERGASVLPKGCYLDTNKVMLGQ